MKTSSSHKISFKLPGYFYGIIKYWKYQYRWLLLLVLVFVIVELALLELWIPITINKDSERYLLSAISQGLAALLGLTFTISLIALQVSYKDARLLDTFFKDIFNILYPLIMAVGIVYPLIILKVDRYDSLTNIAIAIGTLSVFLVLPYFLRMKEFVKLNVGIRMCFNDAKQKLLDDDKSGYYHATYDMVQLAIESLKTNYLVYDYSLAYLYDLCRFYFSKHKKADEVVDATVAKICELFEMAEKKHLSRKGFRVYLCMVLSNIVSELKLSNINIFRQLVDVISFAADSTKGADKMRFSSIFWELSASWVIQNPEHDIFVKEQLIKTAKHHGDTLFISTMEYDLANRGMLPLKYRTLKGKKLEMVMELLTWLKDTLDEES